jgi:hypothetical protein
MPLTADAMLWYGGVAAAIKQDTVMMLLAFSSNQIAKVL